MSKDKTPSIDMGSGDPEVKVFTEEENNQHLSDFYGLPVEEIERMNAEARAAKDVSGNDAPTPE